MQLTEYIKEYQVRKGTFAFKLGITPNYLSMVLHGKRRLGADAALRCVALTGGKVTLEELLSKS